MEIATLLETEEPLPLVPPDEQLPLTPARVRAELAYCNARLAQLDIQIEAMSMLVRGYETMLRVTV